MTSGQTVHIVEDDDAMRESLLALLDDAGYETHAYGSAEELLADGTLDRGCVVSDMLMPGLDGLALLKRLRTDGSELPLILITGHGDIPVAVAAMSAGAVDFLEKPFEAEALIQAIEVGLHQQAAASSRSENSGAAHRSLEVLTVREREVLELLVSGESNKEVALRLGISHRTVEFHRAHIMEKIEARGLTDLVRFWFAAAA
jgi:two-component system response regulator FixJ